MALRDVIRDVLVLSVFGVLFAHLNTFASTKDVDVTAVYQPNRRVAIASCAIVVEFFVPRRLKRNIFAFIGLRWFPAVIIHIGNFFQKGPGDIPYFIFAVVAGLIVFWAVQEGIRRNYSRDFVLLAYLCNRAVIENIVAYGLRAREPLFSFRSGPDADPLVFENDGDGWEPPQQISYFQSGIAGFMENFDFRTVSECCTARALRSLYRSPDFEKWAIETDHRRERREERSFEEIQATAYM